MCTAEHYTNSNAMISTQDRFSPFAQRAGSSNEQAASAHRSVTAASYCKKTLDQSAKPKTQATSSSYFA